MNYPDCIDAEMRELLDAMSVVVVPRTKRKARVITNWHAPYYSQNRYTRM